ncbi:MAG: SDR family NAD(P)-dependent oxidoreductase [Deltaproteobacteria bacterium]|nr:SDR family NAD(P)-dependent oxidoreductase [Deltaproteobacteria bacterium]
MKVVILGGTKGMGRALARQLFEAGHDIALLGRDKDDLERSAVDLAVRRQGGKVSSFVCDLEQHETIEPALQTADAALNGFDTVVVTAGLFATQDKLEADADFARRVLLVNFTNTVVFCEAARKRLLGRGGGTLCVFSSVAGDRGRKPVAIYGASKAGLSHYLESLDFKFRAAGLKTICVKPGFVKTAMTAGLKAPPFAGEPEGVAKLVVRAISRGTPVLYAPPMWRWVMLVIKRLPRFVMRKISF